MYVVLGFLTISWGWWGTELPIDPERLLWSRVPSGNTSPRGFEHTGWVVSDMPIPAKLMNLSGIMHNGYSTREAAEASIKATA